MSDLLKQAMSLIVGFDSQQSASPRPLQPLTDRDLLRLESEIGRTLFGEIPKGHTREFFCLDEDTWVWHEQWKDTDGRSRSHTTRYEKHPKGVLKVQDGGHYSFVEGQELDNLATASQMYYERVMRELYRRDPNTGVLLTSTPDIINTSEKK